MLRPAAPPARAQAPTPEDTARALHLLRRATYGVRGGDLAAILAEGRDAWLERQLHPDRVEDPGLERRLARFPAAAMDPARLAEAVRPPRAAPDPSAAPDSMAPDRRRRRAIGGTRALAAELVGARLVRAVHSERQLEEVLVDFWFDHFNIFFGKGPVRALIGDYERTAIRPHVLGSFEAMLVSVASHPAMLVYLDNWTSSTPDSVASLADLDRRARLRGTRRPEPAPGATPRRQARGINENYARELLELHTLGINGGYTQRDVVEVARAFTGWTITRPRPGGVGIGFVFRPVMHDPGEKAVLGRRLAPGRGMEDGLEVLRLLARHPSTARHIATKLARRFVADDPPPALVDRLAAVFLETGGDLRAVTRTLFTSEEFYDPAIRGGRIKRPFELVASALRATGAEVDDPGGLLRQLRAFGHVPYFATAPTGYPVVREEWVNSGALLARMNFGLAFAAGRIPGVRLPGDAAWTRALRAGSRAEMVAGLAGHLLPGHPTEALQAAVVADLAAQATADPGVLAERALGLVLGSPEFQHH